MYTKLRSTSSTQEGLLRWWAFNTHMVEPPQTNVTLNLENKLFGFS